MAKKFKVFDFIVLGKNLSSLLALHILRQNGRRACLISDSESLKDKESSIDYEMFFRANKQNKKFLKKLLGKKPKERKFKFALTVGDRIVNFRNVFNLKIDESFSTFYEEYGKRIGSISYDRSIINRSKNTINVFDIKYKDVYSKLIEMYDDHIVSGNIIDVNVRKKTLSVLKNVGEDSDIFVFENLINCMSLRRFLKYSRISFPMELEYKTIKEVFVDDVFLFNDIDMLFVLNRAYNKIMNLARGTIYEFVDDVRLDSVRDFLPFAKYMNTIKYGILNDEKLKFEPVKKIGPDIWCLGKQGMWNNNICPEMDMKTIEAILKEI